MYRKLIVLSFLMAAGCSIAVPDFRTGPVAVPTPPPPAPIAMPRSAKERFIATTAANGCVVNSANSSAILTGATLSVDDLARIMSELKADGGGRIADDGASFRLTTGACA